MNEFSEMLLAETKKVISNAKVISENCQHTYSMDDIFTFEEYVTVNTKYWQCVRDEIDLALEALTLARASVMIRKAIIQHTEKDGGS